MTTTNQREAGPAPVGLGQAVAFSLPALPMSAMVYTVLTILPGYYAKHTTVTLAAIGGVLFASRLFDAVTDPLIGYLSDKTTSRFGARKPWMAAGVLLSMLAVYFLFTPSASADTTYFLVWSFVGYLAWTMVSIPYQAWGSELSRRYGERSRIFAFTGFTGALGPLLFLLVPLLPIFDSTEFTAETLRIGAVAIMIALPAALAITAMRVPRGAGVSVVRPSFRLLASSLRRNRPLHYFIIVFMIGGLSGGIFLSLIFIYLDSYLGIGDKIPFVLLGWSITHVLFVPLWLRIVHRFGRTRSLAASWAISAALSAAMAFVSPGPSAFIIILVLVTLRGIVNAADTMIPSAVFADVIDYDVLKSGTSQAGNFYAFLALATKFNLAIGGATGFLLLSQFGYEVNGANDALAEFGLTLTLFIIPIALSTVACVMMWRFPITARRQGIIRKRIEQRALRAGVV